MTAAELTPQIQDKRQEKKAGRYLPALVVIITIIAQLVALNGIERLNPIDYGYIRYFTILPVVSVAYLYGVVFGLLLASFFGLLFLVETFWLISQYGYTAVAFELIALILVLEILALVVGDLTNSLRQRASLRKGLQAREDLMSRTFNLVDLTRYILDQACTILQAEQAELILRSPITDQWQIISADKQETLGRDPQANEPILAGWLLSQSGAIILNNLDRPQSPFIFEGQRGYPLQSLLCRPLFHSDGSEMGRLILSNKQNGYFQPEDLEKLSDLAVASEVAIEQARHYARTDYDLERRVNQLAAIQRTSQQLNATLDADKVVDLTLEVALELTQAEAGVILLNFKDLISMLRNRGNDGGEQEIVCKVEQALEEGSFDALKSENMTLPLFFTNSQSQMISFISHGDDTLGLLIVESQDKDTFDQTTQWVLDLLADHAAISLANARLFQEIKKEKQHAAMVIESVTNGLLTTDREGRILTANPAAEEQTGWKAAEMLGMYLYEVIGFSPVDENRIRQAVSEGIELQRSFNLEPVDILTRKGGRRIISMTGSPVYEANPEPSGMVILVRDLTEREEFNRLQDELISSISHEMRTPLAKINSVSEMISSELSGDKAHRYSRYLHVLTTESQRLAGFLDRILDVYQLETRQFDLEIRPLPLSYVVQSQIEEWQIMAPERKFELSKPQKEVWVMADENSLHSVLNNLIENAVKYAVPQSPIMITIGYPLGEEAEVCICDLGPGIPVEYHSRLFERFFRVDGADAQIVYGHGIGLYVAKILLDSMGGRIWMESQPGEGSRFVFTLPVQEELTHGA